MSARQELIACTQECFVHKRQLTGRLLTSDHPPRVQLDMGRMGACAEGCSLQVSRGSCSQPVSPVSAHL